MRTRWTYVTGSLFVQGSQDGNIITGKCRPSSFKRILNRKHGSVVLAFVFDEWFVNFLRRQAREEEMAASAFGEAQRGSSTLCPIGLFSLITSVTIKLNLYKTKES
nr:hypothetical protein [Tanacetum cinerariifolium]